MRKEALGMERRSLKRGACSVSGATDEEGGSWYGKEKRFSEVLGEKTKKRGVWLVFPLDVKEMELLVGRTPRGSLLCSWCWLISKGRGLRLNKRYR